MSHGFAIQDPHPNLPSIVLWCREHTNSQRAPLFRLVLCRGKDRYDSLFAQKYFAIGALKFLTHTSFFISLGLLQQLKKLKILP